MYNFTLNFNSLKLLKLFLRCNVPYNLLQSNLNNITVNKCDYILNNTKHDCKSWDYDKTYYKSTLTEKVNKFFRFCLIFYLFFFQFQSGIWCVVVHF